jgi:hypothetical protein
MFHDFGLFDHSQFLFVLREALELFGDLWIKLRVIFVLFDEL